MDNDSVSGRSGLVAQFVIVLQAPTHLVAQNPHAFAINVFHMKVP